MTALVLFPLAVGLVFAGAALAWPVARRVGEHRPDRLYWEPVETFTGRRWRPVQPRPALWVSLRARLAEGWASCEPRDPHRVVRLALQGTGRRWAV